MQAVWNGAPLTPMRGSAKSLGLVRTDSESTATVTRQVDDDGDPETVLKGQKKIALPLDTGETRIRESEHASTDDDDLNETARADEHETPVGVKRVSSLPPPPSATPASGISVSMGTHSPSSPPPAPPPESGQTRVAPIVAPPPTVNATPVALGTMAMNQNTPPHGWTPATIPPGAIAQGPVAPGPALAMKLLALPPHKIALAVSLTLMMAALMFVFVRSRSQPAPGPTAAATFPPPVEVLPPAAAQPPLPVLLPPPAPTWNSQAQAQTPASVKNPAPIPNTKLHPHPSHRATSRTSIPVQREQ